MISLSQTCAATARRHILTARRSGNWRIRLGLFFAAAFAGGVLLGKPIHALLELAVHSDSYTYVLVVPAVSIYLIYSQRRAVFANVSFCFRAGFVVLPALVLAVLCSGLSFGQVTPINSLCVTVFAGIAFLIAAFIAIFGMRAFQAALFPLLFLFLMVPIPQPVFARIIGWLQAASSEGTFLLLQMLHIPVFRQGSTLSLPNLTIEVAGECSSIRSSTVTVLTAIVSAHLFLRRSWTKAVLVFAALPIAVFKNVIRICTLSTIALYIDPGVLHSRLHRQGGILFFLFGLGVLVLLLFWFRTLEPTPEYVGQEPAKPHLAPSYAAKSQHA